MATTMQSSHVTAPVPASGATSKDLGLGISYTSGMRKNTGQPYIGRGLNVPGARINKRHRVARGQMAAIHGITKGDIRRLARRGGIKRIKMDIYDTVRTVLDNHLRDILKRVTLILEHQDRKIVKTDDIVYALYRMGRPLYGFCDPALEPSRTRGRLP